MKKSLIVSISTLLLSVLTLGACGPAQNSSENPSGSDTQSDVTPTETQEIFTIQELLNGDISDETGMWEPTYLGRHVRIEKAGVVLAYEHEMYIQQTSGETVGDLHSIQVINNDVDFTEFFYNNLVNVEGDIALFEDRIVIENADVTLLDDGKGEDVNYVYFWPNMNRQALDNATRFYSGTMVSSVLQVASKPTEIKVGEESSFKLTFPGEDLDYENEDNLFVMDYIIPNCLSEKEVKAANELFGQLEVGDGLTVLAAIHFAAGSFSYLYMPGVSTNEIYNYPTVLENIFGTAQEAHDQFIKFHSTTAEEYPLLEAKDANGKSLIYSYVGNDDRFSDATHSLFQVTAYTYKDDEVFEALKKQFDAKGWTVHLDYSEDEGVIEYFSPVEKAEDKPNNVADIMLNEGSVTIAFITETPYKHPVSQTFETFDELKAGLKVNAERYARDKDFLLSSGARNFKSQIVDAATVLGEGETIVSYFLSKDKESMNVYNNIEAAHELIKFNLSVTDETRLNEIKEAYIKALEANGFVKINVPANAKKAPKGEGYFNQESGEFIATKGIKVKSVAATDEEEAHGELSFFVDCVSIEVYRQLKKLLPETETKPAE